MSIIEARGLARTFKTRGGEVQAVGGVDLPVEAGGLVGFLGGQDDDAEDAHDATGADRRRGARRRGRCGGGSATSPRAAARSRSRRAARSWPARAGSTGW